MHLCGRFARLQIDARGLVAALHLFGGLALLLLLLLLALGEAAQPVEDGEDVPTPGGQDARNEDYSQGQLRHRFGHDGRLLCDHIHGHVEALLPGEAYENAQREHEAADGRVRLLPGGLHVGERVQAVLGGEGCPSEDDRLQHLTTGVTVQVLVGEEPGAERVHDAPRKDEVADVHHGCGMAAQEPFLEAVVYWEAGVHARGNRDEQQGQHLRARVREVRHVALGVRQHTEDCETQPLHREEGERERPNVLLRLLDRLVPEPLVVVLDPVVRQRNVLTGHVRDEEGEPKRDGSAWNHEEAARKALLEYLLHHAPSVDGGKPGNVAQEDTPTLHVQHDLFFHLLKLFGVLRRHRLEEPPGRWNGS
mmetsp:Transcript_104015/g.320856  ORF Transcript_104015/g.320856 Transcript_104015/m.320856 type:complete len:364 (-) Transcript_104015:422-1513(-)